MATNSKIIDLRNLLAERFPHASLPASTPLVTGLPFLDKPLGGGLPKSTITELSSSQWSAGSASLVAALLQTACRDRYFIALVDGRDSFDPGPLGNVTLRHLLWVRCEQASQAIKSADLLLRDGNFPLVVLDLILNPAEELRRIPQASWYRLQRLVEPAPTALLVLTRRSMISSAQWKIVLENSWKLSHLERESTELHRELHIRVQRAQGRHEMVDLEIARAS